MDHTTPPPTDLPIEVGSRDNGSFGIPEMRERLTDVGRAYPGNPIAADLVAILDTMLALHDCRAHVHDDLDDLDTGHRAVVLPLRPRPT